MEELYNTTETWKDFFNLIDEKYKSRKCEYIYPWYKKAVFELIGTKSISEYWKIDVKTIIKKNIHYETVNEGGAKTRKSKKYKEIDYPFFDGSNIYDLDYSIYKK